MASWLHEPAVQALVPFPLLAALGALVWLFFRGTWKELDREALVLRGTGVPDHRALVACVVGVAILTVQEYYGGRFFSGTLRPLLARHEAGSPGGPIDLATFGELYRWGWWGTTRIVGYLLPLVLWRLAFRGDRILDYGLRVAGFRAHAWIYALCVAVVVPALLVVQAQPDFGSYYPFYKLAGRSWVDFLAWEAIYVAQFLALEIFFRGWWLRAMRSFGAGAIFAMTVPYTMIHFGKPYLEAMGAIVAGVVLGSLSARTRSVWAGFLVHATVALLMDCLSLSRRGSLPTLLTPGGTATFEFRGWDALFWGAWLGALLVLAVHGWRRWPEFRAWLRARSGGGSP